MGTVQNEYDVQAEKFLTDNKAVLTIKYKSFGPHFENDKENRNIYTFRIRRNGKCYYGTFGDSISNSERGDEPNSYDILSCLTKSDPGTFEQFCSEFGYDTDSRSALKTYKAVKKEWAGVQAVFGDVLDSLQEIQ